MNKSKQFLTMSAIAGLCFTATNANAGGMYSNNVGAINLNVITEQMMSFAHYDESISDFIVVQSDYGTMTRLDEYGDDGTAKHTVKSDFDHSSLEKIAWADVRYLNTKSDYSDNVSERSRIRMETLGFNTKDIDAAYGAFSFGAFLSNLNEDIFSIRANGFSFGAFTHYKYHNFDLTGLVNNGSINKNAAYDMFNHSWINAAMDTSLNIRMTNTLYFRPKIYVGYTKVSADKLKIGDDVSPKKDFRFVNVVPSAEITTRLAKNLYAALNGKYVTVYGDTDKNVYVNNAIIDKTSMKDYAEFGLELEYDYRDFVFSGGIHKQIEGFDGWVGDLNVRYLF